MESGLGAAVETQEIPEVPAETSVEETQKVETEIQINDPLVEQPESAQAPEQVETLPEKTLAELHYENIIEEERKKREEALKLEREESELDVTPAAKEEAIEQITEQMADVMEKNKDKDPEDILLEIAETFYEKEQQYQRSIKEKDIELKLLRAKTEQYVEEINEFKYSENKVSVDEDTKYFLNLQKRYKENPKDEVATNRFIKYLLGMISTAEPSFDPMEGAKFVKEQRLKTIQAFSGQSGSAPIEAPRPQKKAVPQGFPVGRPRK